MSTEPSNAIITIGSHGSTSFKARMTCPWCGVLTSSSPKAHSTVIGKPTTWSFVIDCGHCGRTALLVVQSTLPSLGTATHPAAVYPQAQSKYAPVGLAENIARDFREARNCQAAGYIFGAALVGRRVLQSAVRAEVGNTYPTLHAELAALPPDKITATLRNAAQQVRLIGNEAAHAEEVTAEDVHDLLDYTEEILHALFVMPARVAATQARRQ